ncbi:MAG: type IV toxin-antitoxin system AbiEi family antitoxin domain-containing protein [Polyangiaceae bacterium]
MNARDALARLQSLRTSVIRTADAATALRQSTYAASKTMSRLASSGLVTAVRRGTWWIGPRVDPYCLPEYLTAPMPSYLSLQTALHLRKMIDQIPEVFYAVSLARTQIVTTSAGTFSIHHLAPGLYGGFEQTAAGVKLAMPEKALFDLAYLSGGRSRLFTALPELDLGPRFRWRELRRWIALVRSPRARTMVQRRLARFLGPDSAHRLHVECTS